MAAADSKKEEVKVEMTVVATETTQAQTGSARDVHVDNRLALEDKEHRAIRHRCTRRWR